MNIPKKEIRANELNSISRIMKYAIIFIVLAVVVVILQIGFIVYAESKSIKLNVTEILSAVGTIALALVFVLTQTAEFLKYRKLSKEVEKRGMVEDKNFMYAVAKNSPFGKAIRLMQYILFVATLVMFFGFATHTIFDFSYNGDINLYLPIVAMATVFTGFSIKYVECLNEIAM